MTDFNAHNESVKQVWESFRKGRPLRVPVVFHINSRVWLLNPRLNTKGYTFEDYFERPEVALEVELEFRKWRCTQVMEDTRKGIPDAWHVAMCGQNVLGGGWLGSRVIYREDAVPHVEPLLAHDRDRLFDLQLPSLRDSFMAKAWRFRDYAQEQKSKGFEFEGRPLGNVGCPGVEPPLCLAYVLRGATEAMIDMKTDPDYFRALMHYVTSCRAHWEREVRRLQGITDKSKHWGVGDDPIELMSLADYNEFIYPYHRRVLEEFAHPEGPHFAHICGRVQHHLVNYKERHNVRAFDLGFPVDMGRARRDLGPEVTLFGNVHVGALARNDLDAVAANVRSLLASGVKRGGRFILADGNNVAPGTRAETLGFVYDLVKAEGGYSADEYVDIDEPLAPAYVAG